MKTNKFLLMTAVLPLMIPFSANAENESSQAAEITPATTGGIPAAESKSRSHSWRASEIIGTNVKNSQNETVGEIKDLVVEWGSREVIAVVISTGGFLGVADSLSSVSLAALKYDSTQKVFRTTMSKADLEKGPNFTSKTWPDFDKEEAISSVRTATDQVDGDENQPDNTAQNEKDRNEQTTTPMDQGNTEGDLQMTKDIRQSVVGSDLSFNAKNIKIITNGGRVTLRGVVESKTEHEAILKIVHKHANAAKVTDQLKVDAK